MRGLNDQRKILLPDNLPPSPPPEPAKVNGDVKMSDADDLTIDGSEEIPDSEDNATSGRKLRHAKDRAAERKRKAGEEKQRKEKAEAAKVPKQSKAFLKVLKDIQKKEQEIKECEDEIAVIDNDLREADCPRTRVLGKDRFWNRYYWFERNGMPYAGLPNSSTANAGFANGCIWVQGPDELERQGYIDMAPEYQNEYKAKFNMTVPERKKLEEGKTSVFNAYQWGFYSEPADVDALLNWLDPRGFNELKLRKELINYRDKIVRNMENRKKYLLCNQPTSQEKDDSTKVAKRMSTRGRGSAAAVTTPDPPSYRCLNWVNTTAIEDFGHLHSEQPPPPPPAPAGRGKKQTGKKKEAVTAAAVTVATSPDPAPARARKKGAKGGAR